MKRNMQKKKKNGFTLIELMVVIAILGILAGIAVPRFTNVQDGAKKVADQASARTYIGAINMAIAGGDIVMTTTDGVTIYGTKAAPATALTTLAGFDAVLVPKYLEDSIDFQLGAGALSVAADGSFTITSGGTTVYPIN